MNLGLHDQYDKSRQNFDSPFEYRLKTRFFANNSIDMIMTKIKHQSDSTQIPDSGFYGVSYPKSLTDEEKEFKRLENLQRAVRRARQAVHFACRQINADHMLTLTTRENISVKSEFFEIFTRFVRLVREKDYHKSHDPYSLHQRIKKQKWLYVAVPELQDRGAYHMHIACVGKQDLNLLRACWYVALGGQPNDSGTYVKGQVNVQSNKKRFSGYTDIHKTFSLVRYLTKYISKGFESSIELGQHRYKVSRQIPKPQEMKQNLIACFSNGGQGFVDGIKEVLSIANFIGISEDYELWNRGEDIFILRGYLKN